MASQPEHPTNAPGRPEPPAGGGRDAPELDLAELIPDSEGAIVLFDDSAIGRLVVRTALPVAARGVAPARRTAAGIEVGGMRFVTLAGGPTLYHADRTELELRR
jgi:hypothetical protein